MQYLSVTQLTEVNQTLHRTAEKFISLTDKAKSDIADVQSSAKAKYLNGDTFAELPKSTRQQMYQAEIRKLTAKIQKQFDADSKGLLRESGRLAEIIEEAAPLYDPIRRLNLETSTGEAARDRAAIQQLLVGASQPELETLLARYQAENNLPGLAAVSSISARDDKLRKALPNAKIVGGVKFGDEEQLDAIFHAGKNMTSVLLDEARTVNGAANGARRINAGLRGMKVEDGKVVDIRSAEGGES